MSHHLRRRRQGPSELVTLLLLSLASAGTATRAARAQAPATSAQAPPTPTPACQFQGRAIVDRDVRLFSSATGGQTIARFTGTEGALQVSFLTEGSRAQVTTGTGTGSFRLDGYVEASEVPVYTTRALRVVTPNLWISQARKIIVLAGAIAGAQGRLKAKIVLKDPLVQSFSAWGDCDAFSLKQGSPAAWQPGKHRGYTAKAPTLELYDTWQSDRHTIVTLQRSDVGPGPLLWSSEARDAFVHVEYHGDISIAAWARTSDLEALPPGETVDTPPTLLRISSRRLSLAGSPKVVKTDRELAIRTGASAGAPIVGRVEKETEVYLVDIVGSWASVLPKAMNLLPEGDGQFWVPAAELGAR